MLTKDKPLGIRISAFILSQFMAVPIIFFLFPKVLGGLDFEMVLLCYLASLVFSLHHFFGILNPIIDRLLGSEND